MLSENPEFDPSTADVGHVTDVARSQMVAITQGEDGYWLFKRGAPQSKHFSSVEDTTSIVSTIGAGDALTAAFAAETVSASNEGRDFSADKAFETFGRLFKSVSSEVGATEKSNKLYSERVFPAPTTATDTFQTLWLSQQTWRKWSAPITLASVVVGLVGIGLSCYLLISAGAG